MTKLSSFRRFVVAAALTWATICALTLAINLAVDPLWFWKGNQVSGVNLPLNEREAKINHLAANLGRYDCLIFGSSRATLLPPTSFAGYDCFNFAFSGGQIGEFIAFARYLRESDLITPRLVVIGIDGFSFYDKDQDSLEIPEFVLTGEKPPTLLSRYMTASALDFSMRTLRRKGISRAYDASFAGLVMADAPEFRPEVSLEAEGLSRADDESRQLRQFNPAYAELYGEFRRIFPAARHIAYVPPISAWHVERFARNGVLDSYLTALHACAKHFDEFWDFSIPSPITWDTGNTYDGSHYRENVNRTLANVMLGSESPVAGLRLNSLSFDSYRIAYQQALDLFIVAKGKQERDRISGNGDPNSVAPPMEPRRVLLTQTRNHPRE